MTATELQKRNEKSDHLRVLQTDSGQFFVESGEGKILYSVTINDAGDACTCGDFAKNIKREGISPDTIRLLIGMGHTVSEKSSMGAIQSIMIGEDGTLYGGADPRRSTSAAMGF